MTSPAPLITTSVAEARRTVRGKCTVYMGVLVHEDIRYMAVQKRDVLDWLATAPSGARVTISRYGDDVYLNAVN